MTQKKYKVDFIDPKLYKNSWGIIDYYEVKNHYEAMLEDNLRQGYSLIKILDQFTDGMGQQGPHMFIFERKED